MKNRLVFSSILAASLLVASVAPAMAANNSRQVGLVNVSAGDVEILNNVNLAVAANVAATICDVTVPVAVLAVQLVADGGMTVCKTEAGDITIDQAQPGGGGGGTNGGGNNSRQAGLVNVSLGDVEILNNANIALAANVLVTACDVTVAVAVLALQGVSDEGDTFCQTLAGPITIEQAQ